MGSGRVSGCGLYALPCHASSAPDDLLSIHVAVALEEGILSRTQSRHALC